MPSTFRTHAVLALAALLCVATSTLAQAPRKPVRVGVLLSGFEPHYVDAEREFVAGMRELGYVEGENLHIERRYAHLQPDRMAESARQFAAMGLDAIVTGCTGSTRAVQRATAITPIVMASVADPVGQGFARGLARSDTNVTGRSSQSRALMPKMLELFQLAAPNARRIAVLVNLPNTVHETLWSDLLAAAGPKGLDLVRLEIRGPADLDAGLERLGGLRAHALIVLPDDPMALNHRARIVARANELRLPSFYGYREFVEAGGLASYGERFSASYGSTATFVDKVLRGASPARLPIEQPTRFEVAVNLKTAAAMGLELPKVLLLRADTMIR